MAALLGVGVRLASPLGSANLAVGYARLELREELETEVIYYMYSYICIFNIVCDTHILPNIYLLIGDLRVDKITVSSFHPQKKRVQGHGNFPDTGRPGRQKDPQ